MNTETSPASVDTLATLGVVELLLNPEYPMHWLAGLAEDLGSPLTDAQVVSLGETVDRILTQLAVPFVESLPDEQRGSYEDVLRERERLSHPLPKDGDDFLAQTD